MNNLQFFDFENHEVRTSLLNDEPVFVGKDVAKALGYSQPTKAIRDHVPNVYKGEADLDTPGGKQKLIVINEAGLYKLIFKSHAKNAEKFTNWIASEVLPTIRRHGAYMTEQKIEEALLNPDTLITLAKQLKAEKEQRLLAQKQVEEMTPKAVFHDAVANAENTMLVRDVAHFLRQNGVDIGGTRFFVWLRLNGFLTKNNQPTQLSLERGYFRVKETVVHTNHGFQTKTTPKITGRGQTFFLKKMLKEQEEMREMGL